MRQLALGAGDVAFHGLERVGVVTLFLDDARDPVFIGLVAREFLHEGFPGHAGLADAHSHDGALFAANAIQYGAGFAVNRVELARRQLEELEQLAQLGQFFLGLLAVAAVLADGLLGLGQLLGQGVEALTGFFGIDAGGGFFLVVLIVVVVIVIIVLVLGLLLFFSGSGGGLLTGGGGDGRDIVGRVQPADDDIRQATLFRFNQFEFVENALCRAGPVGQGVHQLAHPLFDALGDGNLTFAGEQLHGTHFAHVHAHRVGGAASFGFHCGECGGGFSGGNFVRRGIAVGHQQGVGIRCDLVDTDAHVVDHLDDVFHLIRIGNILRKMVVHLGIGEIALLFAAGDQLFDARLLLLLSGVCHSEPCRT